MYQNHINKHEKFLEKMKFSGMESVDDDMRGGRQHGHGGNAGEGGEEYQADPVQHLKIFHH